MIQDLGEGIGDTPLMSAIANGWSQAARGILHNLPDLKDSVVEHINIQDEVRKAFCICLRLCEHANSCGMLI